MSRKTNKKTVAKPEAVAQQPSAETQEQVTEQVVCTEEQATEQETEQVASTEEQTTEQETEQVASTEVQTTEQETEQVASTEEQTTEQETEQVASTEEQPATEQETEQVASTEEQTTEQTTEQKEEPEVRVTRTTTSPLEGILERCRKMYPTNKVFYITSDMQVFLEGSKNVAELHQSTLKDGKLTVKKYK